MSNSNPPPDVDHAIRDAAVRHASRIAQERVTEAISVIVALGPDAPATLRQACAALGAAYTELAWGDPSVSHSVPREEGDPEKRDDLGDKRS